MRRLRAKLLNHLIQPRNAIRNWWVRTEEVSEPATGSVTAKRVGDEEVGRGAVGGAKGLRNA